MSHFPPQFEQLLHANANHQFYIQWVDHLDDLYQLINDWIDKTNLNEDATELGRIAAWLAPSLCTSHKTEQTAHTARKSVHPPGHWRHLISQMYQLYEKAPMHQIMGSGHSELEQQLAPHRQHSGQFNPRRGHERQTLDQGLGFLFRHLNELGLPKERQEYVVLELFKGLKYDGFVDMPTAKAYSIIDRIRSQTMAMSEDYLEELVLNPN